MVEPLSYFLFRPVLHTWYNNGVIQSVGWCIWAISHSSQFSTAGITMVKIYVIQYWDGAY